MNFIAKWGFFVISTAIFIWTVTVSDCGFWKICLLLKGSTILTTLLSYQTRFSNIHWCCTFLGHHYSGNGFMLRSIADPLTVLGPWVLWFVTVAHVLALRWNQRKTITKISEHHEGLQVQTRLHLNFMQFSTTVSWIWLMLQKALFGHTFTKFIGKIYYLLKGSLWHSSCHHDRMMQVILWFLMWSRWQKDGFVFDNTSVKCYV